MLLPSHSLHSNDDLGHVCPCWASILPVKSISDLIKNQYSLHNSEKSTVVSCCMIFAETKRTVTKSQFKCFSNLISVPCSFFSAEFIVKFKLITNSEMEAFKCDLRSYRASRASTLKEIQVHSELRPWQFTHPGCAFIGAKTKRELIVHLRCHESTPELRKPFLCKYEGCSYATVREN